MLQTRAQCTHNKHIFYFYFYFLFFTYSRCLNQLNVGWVVLMFILLTCMMHCLFLKWSKYAFKTHIFQLIIDDRFGGGVVESTKTKNLKLLDTKNMHSQ